MKRLKEYYERIIKEYPQHKEEIDDFYNLAVTEIESGESPDNEFELFASEVEYIINGEEE